MLAIVNTVNGATKLTASLQELIPRRILIMSLLEKLFGEHSDSSGYAKRNERNWPVCGLTRNHRVGRVQTYVRSSFSGAVANDPSNRFWCHPRARIHRLSVSVDNTIQSPLYPSLPNHLITSLLVSMEPKHIRRYVSSIYRLITSFATRITPIPGADRLPPECWAVVAQFSEITDLIVLSKLSRMIRAEAIRVLFETVHCPNKTPSESRRSQLEGYMGPRKSHYRKLLEIAKSSTKCDDSNLRITRYVTEIQDDGETSGWDPELIEEALTVFPNLTSLQFITPTDWDGLFIKPPSDCVTRLITPAPKLKLEKLVIGVPKYQSPKLSSKLFVNFIPILKCFDEIGSLILSGNVWFSPNYLRFYGDDYYPPSDLNNVDLPRIGRVIFKSSNPTITNSIPLLEILRCASPSSLISIDTQTKHPEEFMVLGTLLPHCNNLEELAMEIPYPLPFAVGNSYTTPLIQVDEISDNRTLIDYMKGLLLHGPKTLHTLHIHVLHQGSCNNRDTLEDVGPQLQFWRHLGEVLFNLRGANCKKVVIHGKLPVEAGDTPGCHFDDELEPDEQIEMNGLVRDYVRQALQKHLDDVDIDGIFEGKCSNLSHHPYHNKV
ncbi:hypothetical protein C8Q75DRAFT_737009 [Abortiporus biennis]|nr:hypothetical protein C8Q75DRAFT_737009 [Abortiporus biennis]